MRTTIDIPDEVFRKAKKKAAEEGRTLREIVGDALRAYLSGGTRSSGYRFRWRTESGRIQPGVNLDDRDALFDLMDGRR